MREEQNINNNGQGVLNSINIINEGNEVIPENQGVQNNGVYNNLNTVVTPQENIMEVRNPMPTAPISNMAVPGNVDQNDVANNSINTEKVMPPHVAINFDENNKGQVSEARAYKIAPPSPPQQSMSEVVIPNIVESPNVNTDANFNNNQEQVVEVSGVKAPHVAINFDDNMKDQIQVARAYKVAPPSSAPQENVSEAIIPNVVENQEMSNSIDGNQGVENYQINPSDEVPVVPISNTVDNSEINIPSSNVEQTLENVPQEGYSPSEEVSNVNDIQNIDNNMNIDVSSEVNPMDGFVPNTEVPNSEGEIPNDDTNKDINVQPVSENDSMSTFYPESEVPVGNDGIERQNMDTNLETKLEVNPSSMPNEILENSNIENENNINMNIDNNINREQLTNSSQMSSVPIEESLENNLEMVEEEGPKKKKKKGHIKVFFIILLVIVLIIAALGIGIGIIRSNRAIIASSIDDINKVIEDNFSINKDLGLGNTYTYTGNLSFNIQSDLISAYALESPEYAQYQTLLANLSNTTNTFQFIQDADNNKLLVQLNSNLNMIPFLNVKGYIENNTMYYFVEGLLDTYINEGENDYFSTLKDDKTNTENVKYVYDVAVKSLKKNLKDEYFTREHVTTKIGTDDTKLQKISFKIDDKILKELATNILNDLKNDKKADEILLGYYEDFNTVTISNDSQIMSEGEYLIYSVYVSYIKGDIKKYELESVNSYSKYLITYENTDVAKVTLSSNDELIGYALVTKEKTLTTISVMNSQGDKVSTIAFAKDGNSYQINANVVYEDFDLTYEMNNEIRNLIDGELYDQTLVMRLNINSQNTNVVNAEVNMNGKIEKGATIEEDVTNAVDAYTLDSEKILAFYNKIFTTLITPMS